MKELSAQISLTTEVRDMASYISQKWTPIPNLDCMFQEICDEACHDARGMVDRYIVSEEAGNMRIARETLLVTSGIGQDEAFACDYDAVCHFLDHVRYSMEYVCMAGLSLDGPWDFEKRANRLYHKLVHKYPGLSEARPLGWDTLAKGYSDFDGQEEYDPQYDQELFEGTDVQGTCSPNFVGKTALPYVMYDEVCQGRKAARVLVGAVYAQFLGVAQFVNAKGICAGLHAIDALGAPGLVFEFGLESGDTFLKVLLETLGKSPTREDYLAIVANCKAFIALPLSEQEEIKAKRQADMLLYIKESLANDILAESPAKLATIAAMRNWF